jgi:predicted exporter
LRQTEEGWLVMVPLSRVKDAEHLVNRLQEQLPAARYINLRTETSQLVAGFRLEIGERIVWGVTLMLLVLGIGLKSVTQAMRTLLPVFLAIVITMGLLTWSGTPLTLFHLISLMLVLGIGIDYSLFFGRVEQDPVERLHTLHGLVICMLSTSIVFALLGSSELPVLQAIGQTVAVGVVISFLASYSLARRPAEEGLTR